MTATRHFILGRVPGTPHTRYATIEERRVVEITNSRPEGIEVPQPAHYRIALRPFVGGPLPASYFNNVRSAARSQSLQRAGEKSQRAAAARRSLMPGGERDEKLALGRERGAFRRAA